MDDDTFRDYLTTAQASLANGRYILNAQGDPEPCVELVTWALWMETADRRVCQDRDEGSGAADVWVSTVFLGLDQRCYAMDGPPVLWETRVFGGPHDGTMRRYTSRDDAVRGHQAICREIQSAGVGGGPFRMKT